MAVSREFLVAQAEQFRRKRDLDIKELGATEGAIQTIQQLIGMLDSEDEQLAAEVAEGVRQMAERRPTLRDLADREIRMAEDDADAETRGEPSETPNAPWITRAGPPTVRPQDKQAVQVQELDHEHGPSDHPALPVLDSLAG
jgi:hypothetical protein